MRAYRRTNHNIWMHPDLLNGLGSFQKMAVQTQSCWYCSVLLLSKCTIQYFLAWHPDLGSPNIFISGYSSKEIKTKQKKPFSYIERQMKGGHITHRTLAPHAPCPCVHFNTIDHITMGRPCTWRSVRRCPQLLSTETKAACNWTKMSGFANTSVNGRPFFVGVSTQQQQKESVFFCCKLLIQQVTKCNLPKCHASIL